MDSKKYFLHSLCIAEAFWGIILKLFRGYLIYQLEPPYHLTVLGPKVKEHQ